MASFPTPFVINGEEFVAIVVDEDAKRKDKPFNVLATELWAASYGVSAIEMNDHIAGDAVLVKTNEVQ